MSLYRFLDSQHVSGILNGQIRVGNLNYYRLLEIVTGDKWIGDKEEGIARNTLSAISITPENRDSKTLEILEENNIAQIAPGSTFICSQINIISYVNCFIWSMSLGELRDLKPIMTNPENSLYTYNSCIEIMNVAAFSRHLMTYGTINGEPAGKLFTNIGQNRVEYLGNEGDLRNGKIQASPFLKSPIYKTQAEFRFAFYLRNPSKEDHIFIDFPEPQKFIRHVFTEERKKEEATPKDLPSAKDLITVLNDALERHDNRKQLSTEAHYRLSGEEYSKQSSLLDKEFEDDFYQNHFQSIVQAYWGLREKGHKSSRMDDELCNMHSVYHFHHTLAEYLYGDRWMLGKSRFFEEESGDYLYKHIMTQPSSL